MVEESVEHAFDDLAARRWVEAKLKADQLVEATRKGLAACAGELDGGAETQIESALAAVEAALAGEDAQTKVGNAAQLKSATAALEPSAIRLSTTSTSNAPAMQASEAWPAWAATLTRQPAFARTRDATARRSAS